MLIRSQNKLQLLNLSNGHLSIDFFNKKRVLFCGLSFAEREDYTCIGEYSTEAKAIKVLDDIQNTYQTRLYYDNLFDQSANICRPYTFTQNMIFQMPKDEDVIL